MFDWNDQDQVGDSIWDEFTEVKDHIVPYPKEGADDSLLLGFGHYSKKQKNEETRIGIETSEHTSEDKNDFSGNIQRNNSTSDTEKLSAARHNMGSWPDLPSLNVALGQRYNDANDQDYITTELIDDYTGSSNLNQMRLQLDIEPETSVNDHEDKKSESFLDSSWANIGDFDDFERIFSNNDSIFGHDTVGNAGEFLSTFSDVISNTAQSIPLPDKPLRRDQICYHDSSPFLFYESYTRKEQMEEKTTEKPLPLDYGVQSGEQTESFKKLDTNESQLKSCNKPDERNNASQYFDCAYSNSAHEFQQLPSSLLNAFTRTYFQACQTPKGSQQREIGTCNDIEQIGPSSSFAFYGHGYTLYPLPAVPVFQHVLTESNQAKDVSFGYEPSLDSVRPPNSVDKPSVVPSRPTMTPQEKVEKLRRRQQMQALLAIQKQQQQFQHQLTAYDTSVPPTNSPRKKTKESITDDAVENLKYPMLVVEDESQIITSEYNNHTLVESTYYQLQDSLGKLDFGIRLCIRDSLFLLAQSAMERQSPNDRNNTKNCSRDDDETPICGETNMSSRVATSQDAEKVTNPIDRTVAHLLFHRPSESAVEHVKEETESLFLRNPASNPYIKSHPNMAEDDQGNIGEMEVQPSL